MVARFAGTGRRTAQRCETAAVTMSASRRLDLNADLGEGFGVWRLGDDEALLGVVTSANVACGFHAGDPATMRRVCTQAAGRGVAVGAQFSYRDLAGFGRRFLDVEPAELTDDLLYQLAALDGIARAAGTRVSYVKPHGALYNAAVTHDGHAKAVVDAVARLRPPAAGPRPARFGAAALRRRRPVCALSRRASPTGAMPPTARLVPRREPGALVEDPAAVAERAVRMATDGVVVAVDGTRLLMPVESVCVHGDTPGAVAIARAVREALESAGVDLAPFPG